MIELLNAAAPACSGSPKKTPEQWKQNWLLKAHREWNPNQLWRDNDKPRKKYPWSYTWPINQEWNCQFFHPTWKIGNPGSLTLGICKPYGIGYINHRYFNGKYPAGFLLTDVDRHLTRWSRVHGRLILHHLAIHSPRKRRKGSSKNHRLKYIL